MHLMTQMQPSPDIRRELVEHVDAGIDEDRVRPRDKDGRAVMETIRPPQARQSRRPVIGDKFAVRRHHAATVAMPPDGVKKCVSQAALETGPLRPEISGVLVLDRLHREHDAALDRVLTDMRGVSFPVGTPPLAPFGGPITPLVKSRADSG